MMFLKLLCVCVVFSFAYGCGNTPKELAAPIKVESEPTGKANSSNYQSIRYIDSFMKANNDKIGKNFALKEQAEVECTKQVLPKISNGFYDDLPFKLVATTMRNGTAYGNFVYDDDKHYVKVQCIIKESQLPNLQENNQYFIKFKVQGLQKGANFDNEFSRIELPTVNAYLVSFKPVL